MTQDDALAELVTLTGASQRELEDLRTLPPDMLALALENYRDQAWAKPGNAWATFLNLLAVAGIIASTVSGVAGAVSAVETLAKS
jgi:hypothetical protein